MRKFAVKKFIIFVVCFFITGASVLPSITGASSGMQPMNVHNDGLAISVQTVGDITTIHYSLDTFSMTPVTINQEHYVQIVLGKEPNSLNVGAPDLPSISRSIIIPNTATMNIRVLTASYEDYQNINVAPSKGNLPRTINPVDVSYEFNDIYTQNTWYPTTIAELRDPYYIRDFRGQVVTIHPMQYNPSEKTLRFYNDITVEIYPTTPPSAMNSILQHPLATIDSNFLSVYEHHFINFNAGIYAPLAEQGNMLVITYDSFYNTMVPFVMWKNTKGIPTEMVNVSTIGNANAIKTYITNYYNTKGLTFVLLVGDVAQIPTLYAGDGASDPSYSYIVGNDHYPDLFVGRFSAETIAQVRTQVNKTITYERDPQVGAGWYKKGIGIGSEFGVGDDNEYDYEHIRNIRELLMNFTYSYVDEFYGGSQGGGDAPGEPIPSMISTALNEGRSIINYCGHGSTTSWSTSGFSNNNVNALTNYNMFPFIFSVACYNGNFDGSTCFGEAWLRATHNGQPTGAIGAYMSSISQNWSPPMQAQDEFNNILIGMYPDDQKTTFGALCFEGAMSMNDAYGPGGFVETDAWTVFGDPSVQVRTDTPETMTVSHNSIIPYASDAFDVSVPGVRGAFCALSDQNTLLGYGYADETGHATVQLFAPVNTTNNLQLVVTGFNKIPYMDTIIVGPPNYAPRNPTISGPTEGRVNREYTYSIVTTDPENDNVSYYADWGDGTNSGWLGPYSSGTQISVSHTWNLPGTYSVRAKAKDMDHIGRNWSVPITMTIYANNPPNTPTITGPNSGKPGITYLFTFETIDPNNDNVYYLIDWGDNTSGEWLGPYNSGVITSTNHSWSEKGTYTIKIKAKDTDGNESNWGTLKIKVPQNIPIFVRFANLLEKLFPGLFHFFKILIKA